MGSTIKDIARHLKISTSTVSYALNNGPRPVPEEVKRRVLQTARELDYRPNRIARSLVTGRSNTIGVVPPATHRDIFRSPFIQGAFNALVNEAEDLGQDLLLFTGRDRTSSGNVNGDLLDARIDGVIFIAPSVRSRSIDELLRRSFPYCVIAGSDTEHLPTFSADNVMGASQVVSYLYELGHRRIAHITGNLDQGDAIQRLSGFRQQMAVLGLDTDDSSIYEGEFTHAGGYRAAEAIFKCPNRPTAVFAANDEIAYGFYLAAKDHEVRIPEEISIVAFDDSPLCERLEPKLSSVRQPLDEIAGAALAAVVDRIKTKLPFHSRAFPTELVVRDSAMRISN